MVILGSTDYWSLITDHWLGGARHGRDAVEGVDGADDGRQRERRGGERAERALMAEAFQDLEFHGAVIADEARL